MSDFKAKMYQIQFRLGLRRRPRWGSLQCSPRPRSWIKGPTSKGRGGKRMEGGGDGNGEERRPHPFTPPLIHISGYAPGCAQTLHPFSQILTISLRIGAPLVAPSGDNFENFSIGWKALFFHKKTLQTASKSAYKRRRYVFWK